MNRDINFINSDYERLFSIPDGGKICITDRNGEKNTYPCRYIDDYHFELNNRSVYHICQFAEMMERVGATYEPMEMCAVELTVPEAEEADIRRLRTNNGCIGIFRADFRSSDGRYFTSWVDKNQDLLTENFQSEFNAVINHLRLRTPFLRSEAGLKEYCRENPALIKEAPNFKSYTYKAKTDKHTYYFVVTFSQNESHVMAWCYDSRGLEKAAREEMASKSRHTKEAER